MAVRREGTRIVIEAREATKDHVGLLTTTYLRADDAVDLFRRALTTAEEIIAERIDLDERAAIIEFRANVPRWWAEGFAVLLTTPAPTGVLAGAMSADRRCAGVFLDRWAAEAIRCGWSDLDVFGANPDRPDARFDAMGLVLLLDRTEVANIDCDGADLVAATGAPQRYRMRPVPADTISFWELAGRPASALK